MSRMRYLVSVMLICLLSGCMRDSVPDSARVPDLVIEDYVVEDENEFTEWDEESIRQMKKLYFRVQTLDGIRYG